MLIHATAGYAVEDKDTGTVEVRLTDHREAIEDFSVLKVRALRVRLHREWVSKDQAWITLPGQSRTVDLRRVTGGRSMTLLQGQALTGDYDGVDLKVEVLNARLHRGGQPKVALEMTPVAVQFQVQEGKKAVLTLDLIVLDLSDHPSKGYVIRVRRARADGAGRRFRGFGR